MLKAGTAKVKITPPSNCVQSSGFAGSQGTAPEDDLYCRALVLQEGKKTVALANCDFVNLRKEYTNKICNLVKMRCGIAPADIFINATHNHGGPWTIPDTEVFPRQPLAEVNRQYLERVAELMAGAIVEARQNLALAEMGFGSGQFSLMVHNSRFLMRDKTIGFRNYNEADIIAPTGPIDPQVGVLHLKGADQRTIGILYNYACHPATFAPDNTKFWAEYPGITSEFLEHDFGGVAIFTPGACGDIHPTDIMNMDQKDVSGRHAAAHQMGEGLGLVIKRVIEGMSGYKSGIVLESIKKTISLPVRKPDRAEEEDIGKYKKYLDGKDKMFLARYKDIINELKKKKTIKTVLQAVRIGDLTLTGIPGELFVELGLEIKKRSAAPNTFVIGLANDWVGYFPTELAFTMGAYQTWAVLTDETVARSASRTVVEKSLAMIEKLNKY